MELNRNHPWSSSTATGGLDDSGRKAIHFEGPQAWTPPSRPFFLLEQARSSQLRHQGSSFASKSERASSSSRRARWPWQCSPRCSSTPCPMASWACRSTPRALLPRRYSPNILGFATYYLLVLNSSRGISRLWWIRRFLAGVYCITGMILSMSLKFVENVMWSRSLRNCVWVLLQVSAKPCTTIRMAVSYPFHRSPFE